MNVSFGGLSTHSHDVNRFYPRTGSAGFDPQNQEVIAISKGNANMDSHQRADSQHISTATAPISGHVLAVAWLRQVENFCAFHHSEKVES